MKITVVEPFTSAKEMTTRYISARYNCTPADFAARLVRELMSKQNTNTPVDPPYGNGALSAVQEAQ